ncbi:MAG: N-acetylmuramoyl-L-alanine amidase [Sphingobacteriales bacterium]|nr:N-acetylmuramoyl-L-alanine amidase [Sphingobacteriales bacterium]
MIKRTLLIFIAASLSLIIISFTSARDKKSGNQKIIKTIIVDAGHGIMENGGHNGARGSYSNEDDICLAVSKELVKNFQAEMPEIRIVESRPTEKITALHRRAEIANENKGDLFICIHVNAALPQRHSEITGYKKVTYYTGKGKNRKKKTKEVPVYRHWTTPNPAKGTETYIWGAHKNEDKEVAMRENAPMLQEENYKLNYGDIDPNSPEFIALSLLKTKQYFKRSATLAGFVQDEFAKIGRVDRDVRQRGVGIWVLQATAMPSILVETGYITNREEEDYLNSKEGQKEIADCVIKAVRTYITWLEKQQQEAGLDNSNTQNQPSSSQTEKDVMAMLNAIEEKESLSNINNIKRN